MIIDEEVYLKHFGVKGMKWGVRQGKKTTGISRARAARVQGNETQIKLHKNIRDRKAGPVLNALTVPDRVVMGKNRFEKYHNAHISKLEKQNERIKSGKLHVGDRLAVGLGTSPVSMIIAPKK